MLDKGEDMEIVEMQEKVDVKFKDLLHQTDYMKVLIANTISRFGDSIDAIAFSWMVYAITKSASWSAIILALNYLPTIVIQPIAGTLVERMNKKRVVIITDFIRGGIVASLAVLYVLDLVSPAILIVFTLMISIAESFNMPAASSLFPKLLEKDFYEYGVAVSGTAATVVQLIGMASAGVIIGLLGVQAAILIDGGTFFLCALITMLVRYREPVREKIDLAVKAIAESMKDGWKYAMKKPPIRNFLLIAVTLNALLVPLNAFQAAFIVQELKQGSEFMSVLGIALMVGMGVGSMSFPKISKLLTSRSRLVAGGFIMAFAYGVLVTATFFTKIQWVLVAISIIGEFMLGYAASIMNATVSILFMNNVEDEYYARVGSTMNALATAAMPIMSFVMSGLAAFVSVGTLYLSCAVLTFMLFLLVGAKKLQFE